MGDPDMAVRIHGHAVGIAILLTELDERLALGCATFGAAETVHLLPGGIAVIEPLAVRREAGAVRHAIIAVHDGPAAVGRQAIERAAIMLFAHVHRAAPDGPLRIRLAIVHPVARKMRLRIAEGSDGQRIEADLGKADLEPADEAARFTLRHPAQRLGHGEAFDRAALQRQPVERRGEDIDPIDRVAARRPERPLAQRVGDASVDQPPFRHQRATERR